ncbi:hypothetical protein M427DRAFT_239108 [Gonapodya prolifera JEL478]|uniref:Uncharacterized protein n=1 Tax=Gonapodya prolifera (strain JEL478) TaxID=1344416 RepID=A0A138ZXY4_GONPJ|nr:hypothetical protein M427DRAFT_239108 [Gonapodya prolifera JEL478]|eukprot:KXS09356.1 hypothetical protein M427DRAFT_239108 [Gonapodya prolifera JEL478]
MGTMLRSQVLGSDPDGARIAPEFPLIFGFPPHKNVSLSRPSLSRQSLSRYSLSRYSLSRSGASSGMELDSPTMLLPPSRNGEDYRSLPRPNSTSPPPPTENYGWSRAGVGWVLGRPATLDKNRDSEVGKELKMDYQRELQEKSIPSSAMEDDEVVTGTDDTYTTVVSFSPEVYNAAMSLSGDIQLDEDDTSTLLLPSPNSDFDFDMMTSQGRATMKRLSSKHRVQTEPFQTPLSNDSTDFLHVSDTREYRERSLSPDANFQTLPRMTGHRSLARRKEDVSADGYQQDLLGGGNSSQRAGPSASAPPQYPVGWPPPHSIQLENRQKITTRDIMRQKLSGAF